MLWEAMKITKWQGSHIERRDKAAVLWMRKMGTDMMPTNESQQDGTRIWLGSFPWVIYCLALDTLQWSIATRKYNGCDMMTVRTARIEASRMLLAVQWRHSWYDGVTNGCVCKKAETSSHLFQYPAHPTGERGYEHLNCSRRYSVASTWISQLRNKTTTIHWRQRWMQRVLNGYGVKRRRRRKKMKA